VILLSESGLPYLALIDASSRLDVSAAAATLTTVAG
jgi:hypothetical protein